MMPSTAIKLARARVRGIAAAPNAGQTDAFGVALESADVFYRHERITVRTKLP